MSILRIVNNGLWPPQPPRACCPQFRGLTWQRLTWSAFAVYLSALYLVSWICHWRCAVCTSQLASGLPGPHLFTLDACIDILTETTPRKIGCVSHGDRFGSACECKLQHATCRDCPRLQSLLVHHPLAAAPGRHIVSAPGGCEAQD